MGAGRILAGAVVGVIVSGVMLLILWWIPIIGWFIAVSIGGCAAGLVARGAGAGATAGCLSTLLVVGAIAAMAGLLVGSIESHFSDIFHYLPSGFEVGAGVFVILLILLLPTACCMMVSGAIGGAINKPREKTVIVEKPVEEKPQERVVVHERKRGQYCPYCGSKNLPDALYCSECGEKLSA
jgi:hypothetical protein